MSTPQSNDLVARLRTWGTDGDDCDSGELHQIMTEAADLIEQWEVLSLVKLANDNKLLREAVKKIAKYDCHPHVESDPADWEAQRNCAECKEAAERKWPPSGLCDTHYRILVSERERKQAHAEGCVKYELKDIAREALTALEQARG